MRHHYAPQNTHSTRVLGASSAAEVAPEQVQQLADLSGITFEQAAAAFDEMVDAFRPAPLLWDGDQA